MESGGECGDVSAAGGSQGNEDASGAGGGGEHFRYATDGGGDDGEAGVEVFDDGVGEAFAGEEGGEEADVEARELGFRLVEVTEQVDPGLFGRGEGGADLLEAGAVADEGEGEVGEVLGAQEATGGKCLQPAFFFDPASDHADVDEGV
jgi:hypothetical protein